MFSASSMLHVYLFSAFKLFLV